MTEATSMAKWGPLPGTEAGAYFRVAPNVVAAVPHQGFVQTERSAEASLRAFDAIAVEAGVSQAIVVLVGRVASQSASARRVWARPRARETRSAQALVCDSLLARAIGTFFLGFNRSAVPTRMFDDLRSALAWAETMQREHGRAL